MNKFVLEFEEKHHILEVDGVEYMIPHRTAELEEKIAEHDANVGKFSEYENNMSMLAILFGEEAAKQMFPDGEQTNLDKLSKCAKLAVAAYYATLQSVKDEEVRQSAEELKPILKSLNDVSKNIDKINTANFVRKKGK